MSAVVAQALLIAGAGFMLIAAIGVWRMPDVFRRLHCSTKSATLGVILMLAGAAVALGTPGAWIRAIAAALFFLLTAPVGGHALGRAIWRRRDGDSAAHGAPATAGRDASERPEPSSWRRRTETGS